MTDTPSYTIRIPGGRRAPRRAPGPLAPLLSALPSLALVALLVSPSPARADEPAPDSAPPPAAAPDSVPPPTAAPDSVPPPTAAPDSTPPPAAAPDSAPPLSSPSPAPSPPTRVRLAYRAPDGCPEEAGFVAAVAAQARPFVRAPRSAARVRSLDASITRRGDGHAGVLRVREAGGATSERAVLGDTCAEVFSALALVAALTIDTGPPPPSPPPVPPPPPPPPPPRPRWSFGTAVNAGAFFAIAPVTAWGVTPTFEVTPPIAGAPFAVSVGISFVASPPADTPLGSAELTWLTGRLGVSGIALSTGPFSIRPVADVGLGAVRGRGIAIANPLDRTRPWADVTFGARAQLRLVSAVGLDLAGGFLFPLTRVTWVFEEPPVLVHATPAFGGFVTAGLRVTFPR